MVALGGFVVHVVVSGACGFVVWCCLFSASWINLFLNRVDVSLQSRCGGRRVGPRSREKWDREGWKGGPKCRFFFFRSLFLWRYVRGISVVFLKAGALKMHSRDGDNESEVLRREVQQRRVQ